MSTKITLTYCGMEGCGRTAKEAKQEAARRIEAALGGDYTPAALAHGDYIAVIEREPRSEWGYRLYRLIGRSSQAQIRHFWMPGIGEKWEALSSAAKDLAQNAGHYPGLEQILSAAERRELEGYFAFQQSYARERASKKHEDAYRIACEPTRH